MFPHNTKENLADRIPPACPRNSGAPYLLFKSSYKSFIHQAASPIITLFQENIIFLLEILRFFHLCFCSTKKKKGRPRRSRLNPACAHVRTRTHTLTQKVPRSCRPFTFPSLLVKTRKCPGGAPELHINTGGIHQPVCCVPACIDLLHRSPPDVPVQNPTDGEDKRKEMLCRLAGGYVSRLRRRGNRASSEPGGRPMSTCVGGE